MSDNRQWSTAQEVLVPALRWDPTPKPGQENNTVYIGPVVQGIYIRRKTGVGQNSSTVYEIQLPDGKIVGLWGSSLLDGKFNSGNGGQPIPEGSEVRVTCLGIQQPKTQKGRPYMAFTVEFAKPVTTFAPAQTPNEAAHTAPPVQPMYPQGYSGVAANQAPSAPTAAPAGY